MAGRVIIAGQLPVYKHTSQRLLITSGHNAQHGQLCHSVCACVDGVVHMRMFMHAQSNRCRQVSLFLLPQSFFLLCSTSLCLYFEMHMSAMTQHVPILSDLVSGSADHSRTLTI